MPQFYSTDAVPCPICGASYLKDTKEYYWHLKIHSAEAELVQPDKPKGKKVYGSLS